MLCLSKYSLFVNICGATGAKIDTKHSAAHFEVSASNQWSFPWRDLPSTVSRNIVRLQKSQLGAGEFLQTLDLQNINVHMLSLLDLKFVAPPSVLKLYIQNLLILRALLLAASCLGQICLLALFYN